MSAGVVCAIPARWQSVRLPGKPLAPLAGRPLIQWVWERATAATAIDRVVVLTDDERIRSAVEAFGGECEMTPSDCASGTDRIAWAARRWSCRAVVNVQGDEPLIDPVEIGTLARWLLEHDDDMVTLATPVEPDELHDPNRVKVVLDRQGRALYFSRAPIPYPRHPGEAPVRRHVGLYGYRREALLRLAELEPSPLERSEGLEQLRALENGLRIRVLETAYAPIGVDTPEDLARVEELARRQRTADEVGARG